jgi:hypothetical protein
MFECGIGILAGSMSMLRRLFVRWLPHRTSNGVGERQEMSSPLSPDARSLITIGVFASGQRIKATGASRSRQSKPADMEAVVDTDANRVGGTRAYEELSESTSGKNSVSAAPSVRDGVELTELGYKRRHGSDATDKRPLRETF